LISGLWKAWPASQAQASQAQASHGPAYGAQVFLFDLHAAFGPGYYFSVFDSQPAAWPNPNYQNEMVFDSSQSSMAHGVTTQHISTATHENSKVHMIRSEIIASANYPTSSAISK